MTDPSPPHIPVIVGPTAGGKTALALAVARALAERGLGAEVISADAFCVYRGLDIGTAKPTPEERAAVPHHLIDLREPDEPFTVADWRRLADEAVLGIRARGGVPIVVGGTHLFIKAFMEGLFDGPEPDPALRAEIGAMPQPQRRRELERIDPDAAARIHPNDERRTARAIEVFRQTGTPITALQRQWDHAASARHDAVLVPIAWETEAINRRINARVRSMFERGLVAEAWELWRAGRLGPQAREALGYKQLIAAFEAHPDAPSPRDLPPAVIDHAAERIKVETRRFAKNQRTWLRRLATLPRVLSVDGPAAEHTPDAIARAILDADA